MARLRLRASLLCLALLRQGNDSAELGVHELVLNKATVIDQSYV